MLWGWVRERVCVCVCVPVPVYMLGVLRLVRVMLHACVRIYGKYMAEFM